MADNQPITETWLPIPGHEGSYEVSDQGRVRSLDRRVPCDHGATRKVRGLMLKPSVTEGSDYARVNISRKPRNIHHLVMLAFVGPLPEGMVTRHLNGDPLDNRLVNLRYGTYAENSADMIRHGTSFQRNKTHCVRGHVLAVPNLNTWMLERGYRTCKACTRARAKLQKRPYLDLDSTADEKYAAIMRDAA